MLVRVDFIASSESHLLIKIIVGAIPVTTSIFGQVNGDIRTNYFQCLGTEARLTDCPQLSTTRCYHYNTGLQCLEQTGW